MDRLKNAFIGIFFTILTVALATAAVLWVLKSYSLEGVLVLGICCVAAFWGWVISWLHADGRLTLSHVIVIWLVASGTVMGGASYYLAYREITATLETLSRYVMVETVAGSAGYFLKSAIENAIGISKASSVKRDM